MKKRTENSLKQRAQKMRQDYICLRNDVAKKIQEAGQADICREAEIDPSQLSRWKRSLAQDQNVGSPKFSEVLHLVDAIEAVKNRKREEAKNKRKKS